MTLHFYWTYLETQKGPNYWYLQWFCVWRLLRQRNGELNSGLKLAIIVTDASIGLCFDIDLIDTIVNQGCVTLRGHVQQILCKVLFR